MYMDCPIGLNFNPEAWVCDYPNRASCTANADATCGEATTSALPSTVKPKTTLSQESSTVEPQSAQSQDFLQ